MTALKSLKEKKMSPTVYRKNGYRYFFFSKEEERIHIHIVPGDGEAKFWLKPEIDLAKNYNYSTK
jgi:diadenosine tetraphosphate (Ap4A) HIT family hydrolase